MTGARITSTALQVVHAGSSAGARLRTPRAVLQSVGIVFARRQRVSSVFAQTVHAGSAAGARFRAAYAELQVIYTTGAPSVTRQRAWTYDLDGHTYYALDLGSSGTLLYDITTQKWSHFETPGYSGNWNMKNGHSWRGGKKVIAGDALTGDVYEMDPDSFFDDGWRPVVYEVRGVIFASNEDAYTQYALRLIGGAGRPADTIAPVLRMQFSDDEGVTWSREFAVTLTTDSRQRIQFRSLGSFAAPGRIFRLYDTGGIKFIAYATAEVEANGGASRTP